jgi:hypothetical protein
MIGFGMMAVLLVGGHALCDYPLQGDFLSRAKSRAAPISGVPWYQALGAHVAIHGAMVALVTGIWWLALAEAAVHWVTDDAKCQGRLTFNQDQAIHLWCKLCWWAVAIVLTI